MEIILIAFDGSISASEQYTDTKACAWDVSRQQIIKATASKPSLNAQGDIAAKDLSGLANEVMLIKPTLPSATLLYMLGPMRKLYGAVWHVFKAPSQFTGMRLLFRAVLSN